MSGLKKFWAWSVPVLFTLLITATIASSCPISAVPAAKEHKYVALSFDDGPNLQTTPRLLDGLAKRDVHATFFILGCEVKGKEELLCRIKVEGHQIGQHTYSHVALQNLGEWAVKQELERAEEELQEVLGDGDYWLRPPYGLIRPEQYRLADCPLITWTVDSEDWKLLDAEKVVQSVRGQVQSGDIILMHDIYESSVDAALRIVDELQEEGYEFVTVRELMECCGVEPEAGQLYRCPTKTGRGY